jgi:hypothetical protein
MELIIYSQRMRTSEPRPRSASGIDERTHQFVSISRPVEEFLGREGCQDLTVWASDLHQITASFRVQTESYQVRAVGGLFYGLGNPGKIIPDLFGIGRVGGPDLGCGCLPGCEGRRTALVLRLGRGGHRFGPSHKGRFFGGQRPRPCLLLDLSDVHHDRLFRMDLSRGPIVFGRDHGFLGTRDPRRSRPS